jgi:hypothetical protein
MAHRMKSTLLTINCEQLQYLPPHLKDIFLQMAHEMRNMD